MAKRSEKPEAIDTKPEQIAEPQENLVDLAIPQTRIALIRAFETDDVSARLEAAQAIDLQELRVSLTEDLDGDTERVVSIVEAIEHYKAAVALVLQDPKPTDISVAESLGLSEVQVAKWRRGSLPQPISQYTRSPPEEQHCVITRERSLPFARFLGNFSARRSKEGAHLDTVQVANQDRSVPDEVRRNLSCILSGANLSNPRLKAVDGKEYWEFTTKAQTLLRYVSLATNSNTRTPDMHLGEGEKEEFIRGYLDVSGGIITSGGKTKIMICKTGNKSFILSMFVLLLKMGFAPRLEEKANEDKLFISDDVDLQKILDFGGFTEERKNILLREHLGRKRKRTEYSDAQFYEARRLHAKGMLQSDIAMQLGIAQQNIFKWIKDPPQGVPYRVKRLEKAQQRIAGMPNPDVTLYAFRTLSLDHETSLEIARIMDLATLHIIEGYIRERNLDPAENVWLFLDEDMIADAKRLASISVETEIKPPPIQPIPASAIKPSSKPGRRENPAVNTTVLALARSKAQEQIAEREMAERERKGREAVAKERRISMDKRGQEEAERTAYRRQEDIIAVSETVGSSFTSLLAEKRTDVVRFVFGIADDVDGMDSDEIARCIRGCALSTVLEPCFIHQIFLHVVGQKPKTNSLCKRLAAIDFETDEDTFDGDDDDDW